MHFIAVSLPAFIGWLWCEIVDAHTHTTRSAHGMDVHM